MQETEQEYVKKSFDDVSHTYDEIPFFKISAKYADMAGEVELVADSWFVVVKNR